MAGINFIPHLKGQDKGSAPMGGGPKMPRSTPSFGLGKKDGFGIIGLLLGIGIIYGAQIFQEDYHKKKEVELQSRIDYVDEQIRIVSQQLKQVEVYAREAEIFEQQKADLQGKKAFLDQILQKRNLLVRIVDFVILEMPSYVWLEKLSVDPESTKKIKLIGYARRLESVADFMQRLENGVFFPNWNLVESRSQDINVTNNQSGEKGITEAKRFELDAMVAL